ncbi:Zinc finger and BTB domain-containing protein 49 [Orchesella cincta]|uniref:Zinc finger and BTB domain-containing protein 49 n=1 Tax=Orchesella cincta TaxID=48709 RepID=A0A1D2NGT7_ORCCI|nr:Zinc finger and BTB domain-containing protein 49 [Orchesella cincta]
MATMREENINSSCQEGDEIGSFLSSSSFSTDAVANRSHSFTTSDSGVHSDLEASGSGVILKEECTSKGESGIIGESHENSFFSLSPPPVSALSHEEICCGVQSTAGLKQEEVDIQDSEMQTFTQKQQQNFPMIITASYSVPPAIDLAPVHQTVSEISHSRNKKVRYEGSNGAVKVQTTAREMSNRFLSPVPALTPSPAIAANFVQRFPEPMLYSTPGFQFPKRNTPPQTTPAKHLIQSVLRENQQLKLKFNTFRKEAQAKLKERNESIRKLNEDLKENRRKVLELKLQKEVLVAQEHNAFQEIQDDIENLYNKLDAFSQKAEEYLHPNNSDSFAESQLQSDAGNVSNGNESIFKQISNLQQRMDNYEKNHIQQIAISRVREENFQSFMRQTNEKFVQIVEHLVQNDKRKGESSLDDEEDLGATAKLQFSPIHIPADEYSSLDDQVLRATPNCDPPASLFENADIDQGVEASSPPRELSPNKTGHRNILKYARNLKRKRSVLKKSKNEKVLQVLDVKQIDGLKDQDHPPPPALSLPSRLAKGNQKRSDTMPKLIPEHFVLRQCSQRMNLSNDVSAGSFKIAKLTQAGVQTRRSSKAEALMDVENIPPHHLSEIKMNAATSASPMLVNVPHCRDESKPGFTCVCGSKFSGAGGLYVHCVKTMEDEKFACDLCDRRYHYFASLKAHKKTTHKLKLTQQVGCSRCGRVFESKSERQGHHDERGLTCWLSGSYQNKEGQKLRNRTPHAASTSKT